MKSTQLAAAIAATALTMGCTPRTFAATVTVTNNCSYQIAVGVWPAAAYSNGGWFMNANTSVSFPSYAAGTGGRIWSRHACASKSGFTQDVCNSGTCGGTGIQCAGTTAAGVSEAEINFDGYAGNDYYDVSYVDGFNDIISMHASGANETTGCTSKPTCGTGVVNDGYGGAYSSTGDSCQGPCSVATENLAPFNSNTALYCCTGGTYGTSAGCNEPVNWSSAGQAYVNDIHAVCTGQYAYQYDDVVGLSQYPTGQNYTITFCGTYSGSSSSTSSTSTTSSSSTSGGLNGSHAFAPECATGSRLNDTNGSTTNGTQFQIWTNGGSNQTFSVSNSGVVPSGDYNMAINGAYCLQNNGTSSGSAAVIWACNGASSQSMNIIADSSPSGYYHLQPANATGLCLDVAGGASGNGTLVQFYTCNSTNAQQWELE